MLDKPPRQASFLLTVWEERSQAPGTPVAWRFRLENLRTRQQHGFASIAELLAYLQVELFGQEEEASD